MADLTVPESAQGAFNPVQSGQERLGVAIPSAPMPNVQASAKVQKAASTYKQDAQALITGTKSGTVGAYTPLFESDPERIRATRMTCLCTISVMVHNSMQIVLMRCTNNFCTFVKRLLRVN